MRLLKDIKKLKLSTDVPLKSFTSIKIGGNARYFIAVESVAHLEQCVGWCASEELSYSVLGGGSNLLITDGTITTPVLKLTGGAFRRIRRTYQSVEFGASVRMREALHWMIENGYSGLEPFAGIPATIGGALMMNASAFGVSISDYLESVQVLDREGKVQNLKKDQIGFLYRSSSLSDRYIVMSAVFTFPQRGKDTIHAEISRVMRQRMRTQEILAPTAGCIFKNPAPDKSAGALIEQSGLKGTSYNGAAVSEKHANFIVNRGNASYEDVSALIRAIKKKVFKDSGILLEEEVIRWSS